DIDDGLVLQAVAVGIEPVAAEVLGRAPALEIPDPCQAIENVLPARARIEETARELRLLLHPGAGRGRIDVLHPAVWIGDANAVIDIDMVATHRRRIDDLRIVSRGMSSGKEERGERRDPDE